MKKRVLVTIIVIVALILIWLFVRFIIGGNEDSWIKDKNGMYIKHGVPSQTPTEVLGQQESIVCALNLYQEKKNQEGMDFSSQCLGTCGDYAVDVVHVPRTSEDNLKENQCSDYPEKVKHFIELDKDGNIFRIV